MALIQIELSTSRILVLPNNYTTGCVIVFVPHVFEFYNFSHFYVFHIGRFHFVKCNVKLFFLCFQFQRLLQYNNTIKKFNNILLIGDVCHGSHSVRRFYRRCKSDLLVVLIARQVLLLAQTAGGWRPFPEWDASGQISFKKILSEKIGFWRNHHFL